jgi:signal recognition particle subunit SEC65
MNAASQKMISEAQAASEAQAPAPEETTRTVAQAQLALLNLEADDLEGAIGELERELQVRERCYPRWVAEGKVSRLDAKDRLARQKRAVFILQLVIDSRLGVE